MQAGKAIDEIESAILYLLEGKKQLPQENRNYFEKEADGDWACMDASLTFAKYARQQKPKSPLVILGSIHDTEENHRIYGGWHDMLLTPAQDIIGSRAEIYMIGETDARWHMFRRINDRPKGLITNAPSDRIFYESHYRKIQLTPLVDDYILTIAAFSPSTLKFYPVAEHQANFQYLQKSCGEITEFFPVVASIVEDSRCPYFFTVTITAIISIRLYVWPEQARELFAMRESPLTPTGRRRPLVHWVAKHLRAKPVNPGMVEIPDYLRGLLEFEMDGYQIRIEPSKRMSK